MDMGVILPVKLKREEHKAGEGANSPIDLDQKLT